MPIGRSAGCPNSARRAGPDIPQILKIPPSADRRQGDPALVRMTNRHHTSQGRGKVIDLSGPGVDSSGQRRSRRCAIGSRCVMDEPEPGSERLAPGSDRVAASDTAIPAFNLILQPEFPLNALVLASEALRIANQNSGRELFRWRFVSEDGAPVRASNGLWMSADDSLQTMPPADFYLVFEG